MSCTLAILDSNGLATYGLVEDFRAPTVVGGSGMTTLTQSTSFSLSFTVVAPSSYGAAFTVLGLVQNGSSFAQGPLVFAVGECLWMLCVLSMFVLRCDGLLL